jgi:hypothetical protein
MEEIELEDFNNKLPDRLPISVIMEKRPSDNAWVDFTYQAIGVVANDHSRDDATKKIYQHNGVERFLFSGLSLQLYVDECESYYHNLMSPQPGCYIVAGEPETLDEMPEPYLVSLSFDEAHAYLEGDELVYSVDIPPQLYQWIEAFVQTHYVAIKKTKRKLKNWKQQAPEDGPAKAAIPGKPA